MKSMAVKAIAIDATGKKEAPTDALLSSVREADGKTIYINNVTEEDVRNRKIRITVENKFLFPPEKKGMPIIHALNVRVGRNDFLVNYTIGSRDQKSRSGVMKLPDEMFQQLKIKKGVKLKIMKAAGAYILEKL